MNDIWHINDVDIRLCLAHLSFNSIQLWRQFFNREDDEFSIHLLMLLSYFNGQDEGVYYSKQVSIAFENHYIASFLNIIKLDQKNQTIRFLVPSDLGKSLATAFIFHVVSLIFFVE